MKINIRNLIIIGILGGIIGFIFPNPLIFVPLSFLNGIVCSVFIPILKEDT
jgi:hypothetical protein